MAQIEIPADKAADLKRLMAYYPYRVHWIAVRGEDVEVGASLNRRIPSRMAREGWTVHIVART